MLKKWWVKGILGAVVVAVVTIGAGIYHTEVHLKGQLSEAEDAALSEKYGQACGVGVVGAFVLAYLLRSKKT